MGWFNKSVKWITSGSVEEQSKTAVQIDGYSSQEINEILKDKLDEKNEDLHKREVFALKVPDDLVSKLEPTLITDGGFLSVKASDIKIKINSVSVRAVEDAGEVLRLYIHFFLRDLFIPEYEEDFYTILKDIGTIDDGYLASDRFEQFAKLQPHARFLVNVALELRYYFLTEREF